MIHETTAVDSVGGSRPVGSSRGSECEKLLQSAEMQEGEMLSATMLSVATTKLLCSVVCGTHLLPTSTDVLPSSAILLQRRSTRCRYPLTERSDSCSASTCWRCQETLRRARPRSGQASGSTEAGRGKEVNDSLMDNFNSARLGIPSRAVSFTPNHFVISLGRFHHDRTITLAAGNF